MVKTNKISLSLDNWGIGVSILCSIHCALMPVLIITSAIVGLHVQALEKLETPLFILAATIGAVSIFQTYFTLKKGKPLVLLLIGLTLIILGDFYNHLWSEALLRVFGSLFLVASHVVNKKIQKQSSV